MNRATKDSIVRVVQLWKLCYLCRVCNTCFTTYKPHDLIKRWNTIQMTYHPPGNYPKENSVCQAAGRIFQRSNFSFQEVIREKHFGSPLAFKGMPTPKHLPNANPKWIGPSWVAVFLGGAHLGSKRHHLYGPPPPPSLKCCMRDTSRLCF